MVHAELTNKQQMAEIKTDSRIDVWFFTYPAPCTFLVVRPLDILNFSYKHIRRFTLNEWWISSRSRGET